MSHFTIGICGCERGCGVTHLSIALSNYCCSKLRASTACLELNHNSSFSQLSEFVSAPSILDHNSKPDHITIYGVDYYPDFSVDKIPAVYNNGYRYLLLDFGLLTEAAYGEFLRCDHKIVLGSLAPWKQNSYQNFYQKYFSTQKLREGFYYLVLFGEKEDIQNFSGKHHISMKQIPFLRNPFRIEKEQFPFLEGLL